MAQRSKLFFGSLDGAIAPRAITGGVCYCCKTALAVGPDGAIHAAWRHVYAGNVRDIAFTLSRDGGRTFAPPVRVSDDRWVLDGCPENGPALAVDGHDAVHVVWPTLVNESTPLSEPTLASTWYAASGGAIADELLEWPPDVFALNERAPRPLRGVPLRDCNRANGGGLALRAVRHSCKSRR